ncbi:CHAT domain-containing protein [Chaetomium fimeti]|uniref:CHAT domain-containing protein n=1 Tax=Chaetomium fimeti TaxID=1854472 RepID=A0AAE0HH61_9PEZI|nr:CHAT domain-containing protein [Chaetomium fimeti]
MDTLSRIVEDVRKAVEHLKQQRQQTSANIELSTVMTAAGEVLDDELDRLSPHSPADPTVQWEPLNRLIEAGELILSLVPSNHRLRFVFLCNLSASLARRFDLMAPAGNPDWKDLDRAVDLAADAVSVVHGEDVRHRCVVLYRLSRVLEKRGMYSSNVKDIELALQAADESATHLGVAQDMALDCRVQVVKLLTMLFTATHGMNFIERAVAVAQEAVDAMPKRCDQTDESVVHERQLGLNTLARALGMRFEAKGAVEDLDRAIALLDNSLPSLGAEDPNFVIGLDYLGILLGTRFEQQGDIADLNDAIQWSEVAVKRALSSDPDRPRKLQNLADRLAERGQYTGQVADIVRAIEYAQEGLQDAPLNHGERAKWLGNLGAFFGMRYRITQPEPDRTDLAQATKITSEAIDLARKRGDVVLLGSLANTLGNILRYKYEAGDHDDATCLDRAAEVLEEALDLLGPDPEQAFLYHGLGETLLLRYEYGGAVEDVGGAIQAYQRTLDSEIGPPTVRINAAVRAAELLGLLGRWAEATNSLERAVHLLHVLTPGLLQTENKQQLIRHFSGVGAAAAAAALNAGKDPGHALGYLELGRGIISGFLLDMRTDTSALRQAHPDLADQFLRLSSRLAGRPKLQRYDRKTGGQPLFQEGPMAESFDPSKERWRRAVGSEMEALLTEIRSQPEFERFLLPPTVEQLKAAADPDPIFVANVSAFRCDVFVVESHQIRAVPLPHLCQERIIQENHRVQMGSGSLSETLKWLWHALVRPALDGLGLHGNVVPEGTNHAAVEWPRVWWVAVGPLSGLPLHAAGDHGSHNQETALDWVMSSYSSSIKALIAGRTSQPLPPSTSTPGRTVLISMPNTPGQDHLNFTDREVNMLTELCPSMQLTPERPPSLTKDDVLGQLRGCRVFHFAGHGITDPGDPSKSCLLLNDWETRPLTVGDLREERLVEEVAPASAPFLAYLSACSTAANEKLALTDEAIHLVSACQLAGFRHVVGTLWSVSDVFCVDVARRFYEVLRDEGATDVAVCRALHLAMRELRDIKAERKGEKGVTLDNSNGLDRGARVAGPKRHNLLWVPYVHFGV